ncbi:MAG: outer membrane lipoprotein carrier protein LolA [Gemmatimonadota bacterium]
MTTHSLTWRHLATAILCGYTSVAAPSLQAQAAAGPDVRDILARAEARYGELASMQADFEQTIEIPILERSRTGHGVWYQKGPGRFKMDFVDPSGDKIVADGEYLWLYYPSTHPNQVIRSSIDANATGAGMADLQGRIFLEARGGYEAGYVGTEIIGEASTHLISLRPLGESHYRSVRVWIDVETFLVRRFEITEHNETIRTVTLSNLKPNQEISDSEFRFTIPPGADLFAG